MFEIVKYAESFQKRWDLFVLEKSLNGTFLQTRKFLNYHPQGRFMDASLVILQGSTIVAVIPAHDVWKEGKKCFISHAGSTFGGIVIDRGKYNIATMEEIFHCLEEYLKFEKYQKAVMKMTSDIFSEQDGGLFSYYLYKYGWQYYAELSLCIRCNCLSENILDSFSNSRRRGCRYAEKNGMEFQKLENEIQITEFYQVLCKNLRKYETEPVHTLAELMELKKYRLKNEIEFYGAYWKGKLIAGSMVFCFGKRVFHTQYLASDSDYSYLYPMNFLDYHMIRIAKEKGFTYFSFGISTEDHGKVLNKTLAQFKEGFGCEYSINYTYSKEVGGK